MSSATSQRDDKLRTMTKIDKAPTPAPPPVDEAGVTGIKLTEQQQRARRARSIAIAVSLGVLVVLFYIVTLVKGPGVVMYR
jgi:hypothetical protein